MHYVLIFMLLTQDFGSVTATAEFDTLAACEQANDDLRLTHNAVIEPHNAYILGKCYPSK